MSGSSFESIICLKLANDGKGAAMQANEIFRTFWHGGPLNPYNLMCLRSFVSQGHQVEIFTYDDEISIPDWATRREANEILPTKDVLCYQNEQSGGFSLHSNMFRLAMLHRLGGWWIDTDVMLLGPNVPVDDYFFVRENDPYLNTAIMKFPAGHPLLAEGLDYCRAAGTAVVWGQTGPRLFDELAHKYQLIDLAQPAHASCPVPWYDIIALFDPALCGEVQARSVNSIFLHLCMQMWHRAKIPFEHAPPEGSFLDRFVSGLDCGVSGRMHIEKIRDGFERTMRIELLRRTMALELTIAERTNRLRAVEQTLDERNQRLIAVEKTLDERTNRLITVEKTLDELGRANASNQHRGAGQRFCEKIRV